LFTSRDGSTLSAAAIQSGYILAANTGQITNSIPEFCNTLSKYLDDGAEKCVQRVSTPGRTYIELAEKLSTSQSREVQELNLNGASLYKNQWRYYPGQSLAARSIGFIGFADDGTELRGKYGLERQYDDVLFEKRQVMSVNFFAELFSNLGQLVYRKETESTGDVVTSLEPSVSRMLDSILLETNKEFDSKLTGAIIMRPDNGQIVAMNAVPGFDLNDRKGATIDQFQNPLVENVYEFGSTIKSAHRCSRIRLWSHHRAKYLLRRRFLSVKRLYDQKLRWPWTRNSAGARNIESVFKHGCLVDCVRNGKRKF